MHHGRLLTKYQLSVKFCIRHDKEDGEEVQKA